MNRWQHEGRRSSCGFLSFLAEQRPEEPPSIPAEKAAGKGGDGRADGASQLDKCMTRSREHTSEKLVGASFCSLPPADFVSKRRTVSCRVVVAKERALAQREEDDEESGVRDPWTLVNTAALSYF